MPQQWHWRPRYRAMTEGPQQRTRAPQQPQAPTELLPVHDCKMFVGGRLEAESREWLLENNINFIVSCAGDQAQPYKYGISPERDGNHISIHELPINYRGSARNQHSGVSN